MINNRFRLKCPDCGTACWNFRNSLHCTKAEKRQARKARQRAGTTGDGGKTDG